MASIPTSWLWAMWAGISTAASVRPPPPPPYPAEIAFTSGYNGGPATSLCCQNRLIGWTPEGDVAVLSSSYSSDQEAIRYGIDLHTSAPDPTELFAIQFFLADDSLPQGCQTANDPLSCVWKRNQKVIGEALRQHHVASTPLRLKPLPRLEFQFVPDPLPSEIAQGTSPFAYSDSAGRFVVQIPDTLSRGPHLVPIGTLVRNRPTPLRSLVLRFFNRDWQAAEAQELGLRIMRMDGP